MPCRRTNFFRLSVCAILMLLMSNFTPCILQATSSVSPPSPQCSAVLGVKGLREIMQEEESLKNLLEVRVNEIS